MNNPLMDKGNTEAPKMWTLPVVDMKDPSAPAVISKVLGEEQVLVNVITLCAIELSNSIWAQGAHEMKARTDVTRNLSNVVNAVSSYQYFCVEANVAWGT